MPALLRIEVSAQRVRLIANSQAGVPVPLGRWAEEAMKLRHGVWLVLALVLAVGAASAQFIKFGQDKMVPLIVERGPGSDALIVKRVAFGKTNGVCADELVSRMLLPAFQGNRIDVIERQELEQIRAEHQLGQSGEVDPGTAVAIGKILGPSALILVKVFDCRPSQESLFRDEKDYQGRVHRIYISKTRFALEGSVEVTDLTTGRVLGSNNFQAKPEQQTEAENAQPEFPPSDVLKDRALVEAKIQISNIFFPGVEEKKVQFYDDKDCGLKEAYQLYERGDHEGALKLMVANLDGCKSGKKEKSLMRAYYDVGLGYCAQKNFTEAQQYFHQAMQAKGAEAVAGTSSDCTRSEAGVAATKVYREKFALLPDPLPIGTVAGPPPVKPGPTPKDETTKPEKKSPQERLKDLKKALDDHLITQKEYDAKKAEILKEM